MYNASKREQQKIMQEIIQGTTQSGKMAKKEKRGEMLRKYIAVTGREFQLGCRECGEKAAEVAADNEYSNEGSSSLRLQNQNVSSWREIRLCGRQQRAPLFSVCNIRSTTCTKIAFQPNFLMLSSFKGRSCSSHY